MGEYKCPICQELFSRARLAFSHLIWKHPTEYVKFKRSILPTTDPIILMCQQMNRNKTSANNAKIKMINGSEEKKTIIWSGLCSSKKEIDTETESISDTSEFNRSKVTQKNLLSLA